ncbi:hypothetical protein D3C74_364240 [compost metagenome]
MLRTFAFQLHPADMTVLQIFQITFSAGPALQCSLIVFLALTQCLLTFLPVFCAQHSPFQLLFNIPQLEQSFSFTVTVGPHTGSSLCPFLRCKCSAFHLRGGSKC